MKITCLHCGAAYECGAEYFGKSFQCSACGTEVFVPAPSVPPQPVQYPQTPYYAQYPQPPAYYAQAPVYYAPPVVRSAPRAKQRWVYIMLALLFGGLGAHDFYAGETGHGFAKFLLTLGTAFFSGIAAAFGMVLLLLLPLCWFALCGIWVILDVVVVKEDAEGVPFE